MLTKCVVFARTIFDMLQQFDTLKKQVFGVTLWSLWKNRNNKVWNDTIESAQIICDKQALYLIFEKMRKLSKAKIIDKVFIEMR